MADRFFAAVCKRGHWISFHVIDPVNRQELPESGWADLYSGSERSITLPLRCGDCGAPVMTACMKCNAPLPVPDSGPPKPFCTQCGTPHPWATREERTRDLQNQLEFDELDEATQLAVIENLAVLAQPVDEVDTKTVVTAAEALKRLAPKLWALGQPVLTTLLTSAAKAKLGLP